MLFLLFFIHLAAQAEPTSTANSSVRALGMGDAYTALADDESALFYNPAGLARVRGINWKIFGVGAGASGLTAASKVSALQGGSASAFSDAISELYGEHVWTGLGGESIFTLPMFGFGIYNHGSALIRVDNPVYPNLHVRVVNDYGYVFGVGVPAGPIHFGLDLKYIKRTGADIPMGPSYIADLDPAAVAESITAWGVGYGADAGVSLVIPAPFFSAAMSAVWKNMGKIQFRSLGGSEIPDEDNNVTLGLGLDFDLPLISIRPAIDVNYLNRSDLQLTRKVNFGIEIGLPLLDIRGGFREGYYTAGVGLNLGLFRVDAATYGVELGEYPGQIEDRRYVAEFTMQLGLGNFSADGSSAAKGGKAGARGPSSNSSESLWGGKRLKQRR